MRHDGPPVPEVYQGDIVVVGAGAANSARLLLNSASDAHPRGLANGSDQVGRNDMFHNCKAVVALSKEKNDTVFQKTLGINGSGALGGEKLRSEIQTPAVHLGQAFSIASMLLGDARHEHLQTPYLVSTATAVLSCPASGRIVSISLV